MSALGMPGRLLELITSADPAVRDRSLASFATGACREELLEACVALERFQRTSENLYHRVRALFFLYALHRFHLPDSGGLSPTGQIPFRGYEHLLQRRFEEAIEAFLEAQKTQGPGDAISSALATAYHRLAFQTLSDQVRRSVRSVQGNRWMFRMGHPADQPLRIRPELTERSADGLYPILRERTPVRMDLSHSAWSDIFFLGMDYPEGACVLNVSIDLGVKGRDAGTRPPVEGYLRVIDEPLLRLTSVDLGATADITNLSDVFDFAKDYLGLLKAALIASGLIPPGIEGSGQSLADLLATLVGPGRGLEMVSSVNDIPKGSRLAVSTNLLGCLISLCMRATRQTETLSGPLQEEERRLVAARAILGEWLGGSGGGWQDSGGLWPGIKLIEGVRAREGDPEFNVSHGRLLPQHRILGRDEVSEAARDLLQQSLVLVHGGMAQNVGPILEMVTEKYLLRSAAEWQGRQEALSVLHDVLVALRGADIHHLGEVTTRNFFGPLQSIIPWATNAYTETLIARARQEFGEQFWGFWMLGGMAGGGMGFMVAPEKKKAAQQELQRIMQQAKTEFQTGLPFAMDPLVYDFTINEHGTVAELFHGDDALLPQGYYAIAVPQMLRLNPQDLPIVRRAELDRFGAACRARPELRGMVQTLFDRLLPRLRTDGSQQSLGELLEQGGFDRAQHEQIRMDLKGARIGLAQNRLPVSTEVVDVENNDLTHFDQASPLDLACWRERGQQILSDGNVAVVTLAAGSGTRWTQGAGVVKALYPFCKFSGQHRTFLETHLAKSRRRSAEIGKAIPHLITTSYLTHEAIAQALARTRNWGWSGPVWLSEGRAVGLRLIPMVRDLRFMWEEMPQQMLDAQSQKVRESLRAALVQWARQSGEAGDYTDNLPQQCLHPVGHWYEVPNLLRNGTLQRLLELRPSLNYLLLHNIDTLGADVDPTLLGWHAQHEGALSFEAIARRIDDRGGGLARINGRVRLVEGLAMPREEEEFRLSYYNSMTTWINVDRLLASFGLTRDDLGNVEKIADAIRTTASRLPTYVTLKEVKKRWGHGQEDIHPVAQFEKLWGDMTALPELSCHYAHVSRMRGQQLKDQAQLDGWLRDGSAAYVDALCQWR